MPAAPDAEQHAAAPQPALTDPHGLAAHYLRPGTLALAEPPPLALYVHIPWCLRKCPYCDFNSHALRPAAGGAAGIDPDTERAYLAALQADLQAALPLVWGRSVHSVFIGGGTPSLLAPAAIDTLLSSVRALAPLLPGAEVTLEANPGTFERARFAGYAAAGVTRLSIGVQSFSDAHLHALGRVHDAAQARAACEEAARSFATWNLDLMYALPQQTQEQALADLRAAMQLAPPHLSAYHLTIEPNTAFANAPPPVPGDDDAAQMMDTLVAELAAGGWQRYEISAYARGGHRSAHNLNYWQFGDYLGIGAGAHSKLSFPHRVVRQTRWRDPATYVARTQAGQALSASHEVARRDLAGEFMMNALRLRGGFAPALFTARTGLPWSAVASRVDAAVAKGWLVWEGEGVGATLAPTPLGFDWASSVMALFI